MSEVFSIEIKKGIRVMARFDDAGELEIYNEKKEWIKIYALTKTNYSKLFYSNHKQK